MTLLTPETSWRLAVKPVATDDCNSILKLPGGTDENDLPCRVDSGWTYSTWEMSADERAQVLEHESIVAWVWWSNVVGVQLVVGDYHRVHTEVDMAMHRHEDGGSTLWSHVARLDEDELLEVRAGARIKLGIDMDPTCAVTVTALDPAEA